MSLNAPTEPRWEQPDFDHRQPPPVVTGAVVVPAEQQQLTMDGPRPGSEESRLVRIAAWLWPVAIVLCFVTGYWWPLLAVAVIIGAVVRRRVWELRRQRHAGSQLLR